MRQRRIIGVVFLAIAWYFLSFSFGDYGKGFLVLGAIVILTLLVFLFKKK
jgi:hypothetical protein